MNAAQKIKISTVIITVATLGILSSCAKHTPENIADTLRVDIGNEISTLDPAKTEVAPDFRVVNDLFAGLIDWNQKNQPIPGMASSYEISKDGKTYTFHLRHDLKFSDGSPIHAADFVYSWKRVVEPKTASSYGFLLDSVVNAQDIMKGTKTSDSLGISATDNYTFVVNLTHPMNEFLTYITSPVLDVVPEKTIKHYGDNSWTDPKNIVTSGAYVLKEHVMNGYLFANKNPNFYQANTVKIAHIKYLPITDTNVAIDTYKSGDLDTTWQNVPVDKFNQIKEEFPNELYVTTWEKTIFYNFNMHLPKFANNLKLRQALSMAIDRNALVNQVLKSGEKPLYSIVTPTIEHGKYKDNMYSWANSESRVNKAKSLYKEAGFSATNPLVVTLKYKNNDLDKKTALAVASMWQNVLGINVKLENVEYKSLVQSLHRGDFEIAEGNWGADYDSVTTYTPLYRCHNGNNHSFYCNDNYDSILDRADATIDNTQQTALYSNAINIANNAYSTIQLYEPTHQRLVKPRVHGYDIQENYLDNVQSKWFTLSNN